MQSLFLNTHEITGSFLLSARIVYREIFIYDKLTKKEEAKKKKRSKEALNQDTFSRPKRVLTL